MNFHENFRDLNPKYHEDRHLRAIKVANGMLEVVGNKLKEMHKVEARKNFREWLSAGNKLTYE